MNRLCPNLPSRERERENEGPEAVSPSLIIAATIMTAGTELIWRQQLAICALQWLHCGYHYMINTFHYRKPAAVQHLESKKVGFGNSTSRFVSFSFFFFLSNIFSLNYLQGWQSILNKDRDCIKYTYLFVPSHFILYCKLNVWQFNEKRALMFKSNNKPLNYIHQVAPKYIFYMSMHISLQSEIRCMCVWLVETVSLIPTGLTHSRLETLAKWMEANVSDVSLTCWANNFCHQQFYSALYLYLLWN